MTGGKAAAMLIGEGKEGPSEVASVTREGRRGEGSGDGRAKKREEPAVVRRGWRSDAAMEVGRGHGGEGNGCGGEAVNVEATTRRSTEGERKATEAEEKRGHGGEVRAVASAEEIEERRRSMVEDGVEEEERQQP